MTAPVVSKIFRWVANALTGGELKRLQENIDIVSAQKAKLEETVSNLLEQNVELEKTSRIDALTGLTNRRGCDEELQDTIGKIYRENYRRSKLGEDGLSLYVILLDLDGFKTVNDTYGHAAGDKVLREAAQLFKQALPRHEDIKTRLGGDEFLIFGQVENTKGIHKVVRSVMTSIHGHDWRSPTGDPLQVGLSMGATVLTPSEIEKLHKTTNSEQGAERVKEIADEMLYVVKKSTEEDAKKKIPCTLAGKTPMSKGWVAYADGSGSMVGYMSYGKGANGDMQYYTESVSGDYSISSIPQRNKSSLFGKKKSPGLSPTR